MKINEIFYSVQGEGYYAGTAAVFVRFSGCNIRCPFCDTKHESGVQITEEEIVSAVCKYPAELVVFTGGEPSLWLTDSLCMKLHEHCKFLAIETNGTHKVPLGVDYVVCSPKSDFVKGAEVILEECDELKLVMTAENDPARHDHIKARRRYLQPCDTGNVKQNDAINQRVFNYVLNHPEWKISLQTQKILNVQ